MMAYSEDHIALAAEYALGTLDADERAQVETMMSVDKDFTAMVQAWEHKLGALNQMVGSVEPRPEVWDKIRDRDRDIPSRRRRWCFRSRGASRHRRRRCRNQPQLAAAVGRLPMSSSLSAQVAALAQHRIFDDGDRRGAGRDDRGPGLSAGSAARGIRPKPRTQVVEVKTPAAAARRRRRNMSPCCRRTAARRPSFSRWTARPRISPCARSAPRAEPGKSFELWLISDKLPRPRSLGVIGGSDFTARPVLASYDADTVNAATYAVTVEQAGGSPDGKPHSAPVFTGKLIETVPPPAAAPASAR